MEAIDLTKVFSQEHEGKWVLYSPATKQVYASADNLEELVQKAKAYDEMDIKDLTIHKVLPFDEVFAP